MDKIIVICTIISICDKVEALRGPVVKHSTTSLPIHCIKFFTLGVLLLYIIKR